jgi:hypothetical protein
MVEDRITDGKRIAELLSSEVTGNENPPYDAMAVTDADPEVAPTPDGERAYSVTFEGERLARVFVQPDRVRVELDSGLDAAREEADERGLRTRPVASEPPRLVVFVAAGAHAKRALDVLGAAATS